MTTSKFSSRCIYRFGIQGEYTTSAFNILAAIDFTSQQFSEALALYIFAANDLARHRLDQKKAQISRSVARRSSQRSFERDCSLGGLRPVSTSESQ